MNPLNIELGLGVLGLVLLLAESFALLSRKAVGYTAIAGLVIGLVLLVGGSCPCVPDYLQDFYLLDAAALFYKGLAIISTIAVLKFVRYGDMGWPRDVSNEPRSDG